MEGSQNNFYGAVTINGAPSSRRSRRPRRQQGVPYEGQVQARGGFRGGAPNRGFQGQRGGFHPQRGGYQRGGHQGQRGGFQAGRGRGNWNRGPNQQWRGNQARGQQRGFGRGGNQGFGRGGGIVAVGDWGMAANQGNQPAPVMQPVDPVDMWGNNVPPGQAWGDVPAPPAVPVAPVVPRAPSVPPQLPPAQVPEDGNQGQLQNQPEDVEMADAPVPQVSTAQHSMRPVVSAPLSVSLAQLNPLDPVRVGLFNLVVPVYAQGRVVNTPQYDPTRTQLVQMEANLPTGISVLSLPSVYALQFYDSLQTQRVQAATRVLRTRNIVEVFQAVARAREGHFESLDELWQTFEAEYMRGLFQIEGQLTAYVAQSHDNIFASQDRLVETLRNVMRNPAMVELMIPEQGDQMQILEQLQQNVQEDRVVVEQSRLFEIARQNMRVVEQPISPGSSHQQAVEERTVEVPSPLEDDRAAPPPQDVPQVVQQALQRQQLRTEEQQALADQRQQRREEPAASPDLADYEIFVGDGDHSDDFIDAEEAFQSPSQPEQPPSNGEGSQQEDL